MSALRAAELGFLAVLSAAIAGCAYEVGYRPEYVPPERPGFIAQGRLLLVIPEEQRAFVYEGPPASRVGDFTTLVVPLGSITEDIAKDVFGSCFAEGVDVVSSIDDARGEYVAALRGDLQEFVYAYTEVISEGFAGAPADTWITPELSISFRVEVLDRGGEEILDAVYDSGVREGERYIVTGRPAERINSTLHATLHALMLQVADDLRGPLADSCEIIDLEPA